MIENHYTQAALALHQYVMNKHWENGPIVGPDPIGKIHWRVTRFIRSYLPWLPGDDRYTYLQGQAYWIRGNLSLFEITGEPRYIELVEQCADYMVRTQRPTGAWLHPPIWGRRGFISTVEGAWASLGLTAAHRETGKGTYLDAALKWYDFQINHIGFQKVEDGLAVNYYLHSTSRVPNVTTMVLALAAELYDITRDRQYLKYVHQMIRFLEYAQLENGELPYAFPGKPHFMCYQYNSFEFLDLAHHLHVVPDERVWHIMRKLAHFLSEGLTERGSCRYNCSKDNPEVNYWTAALATALCKAHQLGLGDYETLSLQVYDRVLARQNPNGGFHFSDKDYKFLRDTRSYPRYLAMILNHLSFAARVRTTGQAALVPLERNALP